MEHVEKSKSFSCDVKEIEGQKLSAWCYDIYYFCRIVNLPIMAKLANYKVKGEDLVNKLGK